MLIQFWHMQAACGLQTGVRIGLPSNGIRTSNGVSMSDLLAQDGPPSFAPKRRLDESRQYMPDWIRCISALVLQSTGAPGVH